MDSEKRKKIFLVIVIVVILLAAFLLWIFRTSDQSPVTNENANTQQPTFNPPSVNLEYNDTYTGSENSVEFSAVNLAKTYAARFGSWSTDNQGANLEELFPLSTLNMQNYMSNIKLDFSNKDFLGVTTKSISAKIINIDDSSAQVLVNTQKIETNQNLEKNVYYQQVQVNMLKSNESWLVDEFIWK